MHKVWFRFVVIGVVISVVVIVVIAVVLTVAGVATTVLV